MTPKSPEIREKKAAVPSESLMEEAARLERLLPQILRRLFSIAPDSPIAEMPVAQLRVCSYLQFGERSMSAIVEELGISTSAVTQLADRMERSGLIERVADTEDRRQRHLRLTRHGAELMRDRRESRTLRAADALTLLPETTRHALLQGLESLLSASIETAPPILCEHPVTMRSET